MKEKAFLSATEFCNHHHIEVSFIHALHDFGLVEITKNGEDCLLLQEQLPLLEKIVRLHYDLHINLEGIDAIHHLLQRVEDMQQELNTLRRCLRMHERA